MQVVDQYTALNAEVASLDAIFKTSQASEITEEVQENDVRRDNAIVGINNVATGYLRHFNTEKQLAAKKIVDNLKVYGSSIDRENYQAQTATINAIVNDWSSPDFEAALTLLGILDWKVELTNANVKFNQKYMARTQEYAAANPDTLLAKRKDCNTVYYSLRDRIVAFNTILSTPVLVKTINEINALIEQYTLLLTNRAPNDNQEPIV